MEGMAASTIVEINQDGNGADSGGQNLEIQVITTDDLKVEERFRGYQNPERIYDDTSSTELKKRVE